MNRRTITYNELELAWIKDHRTMPRAQAHAKFCKKFHREDVALSNYAALCKRNGWLTGRDGRLQPGNIPWSKGKKLPYNANSAKTQFKKGQLPANLKYAGHERLHEDGYIYVSIEEKNPHTGFERRYVLKHKHLWQKKNGPLPEGMCLKCLDGDRQNTDPDNWEAIPRGMLPLINGRWRQGYDDSPEDVRPVVLTLAKLKHKINLKKENKNGRE